MADLPTIEHPDDDPFLWLEEIEGGRALEWVDAQTERTRAHFADAAFAADRDTLRALYDRPDKVPWVGRLGGLLYNFWVDAEHPRGLWRRTTLESYRTDAPEWDVLLDFDALAEAEGEDWVPSGMIPCPPHYERAIIHLSRGGGDATVLREYDLVARRFVPDGFHLGEAKGGAAWLDPDTLLLSSTGEEGRLGATRSGYARTVRLWRRGEAPGAPLFETDAEHLGAGGGYDRADQRVIFSEQIDFLRSRVFLGDRTGPKIRLDVPEDAGCSYDRGWFVVKTRTPWTVDDRTYGPDMLLGIGFEDYLAGSRAFAVLFEPGPRRSLQGFQWCGGRLLVDVLDALQPVLTLVEPGSWASRPLPGVPRTGTVGAGGFDGDSVESDGTILALVQDPLTPPSLYLVPPDDRPDLGAPSVLKRVPAAFDATGLVVTRHEATSSDGERIPYVQAGPPAGDPRARGDAPVHMTGYGGFGVTMMPTYRTAMGKLWLERGGTTVVANIRGGGEFGTPWHDAGRREGKALSHDDFAAVAADLVARGVTRPGRIAAEGGSNGGLLIANMLTRHPEKFGALFCTIPLIDMRRYTKLLAGASWIAEYGDPDNEDDWAFLRVVSAYHAAVAGRSYPPILLATARRDDRVHPGHARKMAAKLQSLGYDAWFYEPAAGGHGYGKNNEEIATMTSLGISFLRRKIGWD